MNAATPQTTVVKPFRPRVVAELWLDGKTKKFRDSGKPHFKLVGGTPFLLFRSDRSRRCPVCGAYLNFRFGSALYCRGCARTDARHAGRLKGKHAQVNAQRIVALAVQAGMLPSLTGDTLCVDCGKPAELYDHREYLKPLDVEPVCKGCNRQRGPARDVGTPTPYTPTEVQQ